MHLTTLKRYAGTVMLACAGLCASVAQAATIFDFTYGNGTTLTGSGTLTADDNGNGTFTATSGTGTQSFNGNVSMLMLLANPNAPGTADSPSGLFTYDDLLLPGAGLLTGNGLLFLAGGGAEISLFSTGAGFEADSATDTGSGEPVFNFTEAVSFTLVARPGDNPGEPGEVPEPATLALLGIGLLGLGRLRRRA